MMTTDRHFLQTFLVQVRNFLLLGFSSLQLNCYTTQPAAPITAMGYVPSDKTPVTPRRELNPTGPKFNHTLPFGIGGRFDLILSNAAQNASDFYDSYIQPLRKGKIFSQQPYQIDYVILPKRGEAFDSGKTIDGFSLRSDYKFQIGMSRQFKDFSDFLEPDFWLAEGEFAPSTTSFRQVDYQFDLFREQENDVEIDFNYRSDIDIQDVIEETWGLPGLPDEDRLDGLEFDK